MNLTKKCALLGSGAKTANGSLDHCPHEFKTNSADRKETQPCQTHSCLAELTPGRGQRLSIDDIEEITRLNKDSTQR